MFHLVHQGGRDDNGKEEFSNQLNNTLKERLWGLLMKLVDMALNELIVSTLFCCGIKPKFEPLFLETLNLIKKKKNHDLSLFWCSVNSCILTLCLKVFCKYTGLEKMLVS